MCYFSSLLEPPVPPTDLSVDSIKSRSVKLSWRDMARSLAQFYVLQISNSQRLSWTNARVINITRYVSYFFYVFPFFISSFINKYHAVFLCSVSSFRNIYLSYIICRYLTFYLHIYLSNAFILL